MLAELETAAASMPTCTLCEELVRTYWDGRIKLWTTSRALRFRLEHASMFQTGSYMPLFASGEKREHVCAFARRLGHEAALVAVPRLVYKLTSGEVRPPTGDLWGNTELPIPQGMTKLRNVFSGREFQPGMRGMVSCRELFAHFPVALLACH
jgi:(1->4)-alpha-D-glucan 1-alpha-D-glucosylmutase